MKYYARLIDGTTLDLHERDHQTLTRMVARGVENGVTLQDGDILKSIEHNKKRFNMSEQLCQIFRNTTKYM